MTLSQAKQKANNTDLYIRQKGRPYIFKVCNNNLMYKDRIEDESQFDNDVGTGRLTANGGL